MYNVYITNQFKPLLLKRVGGLKSVSIEVTVSSKEENSSDYCPNYVQEFGLCIVIFLHTNKRNSNNSQPSVADYTADAYTDKK